MNRATKISYVLMAALLLLIGLLHMSTLLLTGLFSYFALERLSFGRWKRTSAILFLVLICALAYGAFYFTKQAVVALPNIAETTVPAIIGFAQKHEVEVPFTDYESLKQLAVDSLSDRWARFGTYAKTMATQAASFLIGLVVAVSLFLSTKVNLGEADDAVKDNLYATTGTELLSRCRTFYASFVTVMGAQLIISLINTALTAAFLVLAGFPHVTVIVVLTFLCGLLPVIGNLLSNTLITCVGLSVEPRLAVIALVFLISIHKLEYFLNSKIVGHRIKNPMWLTLLGLLLGEKLMGLPGMILAPVVLHYIKVEASRRTVAGHVSPAESTAAP
jgi:predicted PurR-regulated permease PerM